MTDKPLPDLVLSDTIEGVQCTIRVDGAAFQRWQKGSRPLSREDAILRALEMARLSLRHADARPGERWSVSVAQTATCRREPASAPRGAPPM